MRSGAGGEARIEEYKVTPAFTLLLAEIPETGFLAVAYEIMNVYAIKMAGIFMIATSTLAIRTGFIARWIAILGYVLAALLLLSSRYIEGILLVFPLWVLLVSVYIMIDNRRQPSPAAV